MARRTPEEKRRAEALKTAGGVAGLVLEIVTHFPVFAQKAIIVIAAIAIPLAFLVASVPNPPLYPLALLFSVVVLVVGSILWVICEFVIRMTR